MDTQLRITRTTTCSIPLEVLRLVIWDHVECPIALASLCQVSRSTRELALQKNIHNSIILFYLKRSRFPPLWNPEPLLLLCFPTHVLHGPARVSPVPLADALDQEMASDEPVESALEEPSASSPNNHRLFYQARMLRGPPIRHGVEISPDFLRHPSFVRTLTFLEVGRALLPITPEPLATDMFEAVLLSMKNLVVFKWEFRDPVTAPAIIKAASTLSSLRDLVIWRTCARGNLDEIPQIIEASEFDDDNNKPGLRSLTMQLGSPDDCFDDSDSDDDFDGDGDRDGTENDPVLAELWNLIIMNVSTFRHLSGQLSELIQLLKPRSADTPVIVLQSFRFTRFQMSWDVALKSLLQREPPVLHLSNLYHLDCGHSLVNNGAALRPFLPMILPALRTLRLESAFLSMPVQEFLQYQFGLEELLCNRSMTRQPMGRPWHETNSAKYFLKKHGATLKRLLIRERLSQGMPATWFAVGIPGLKFFGVSQPSYTEILGIMKGFKDHSSLETLYICRFKTNTRPIKELLEILNGGLDAENPVAKTSAATLKSIIVESDCGFKYFLRVRGGLWKIAFGGPPDRDLDPMSLRVSRSMMNDFESDIMKWCNNARVNS